MGIICKNCDNSFAGQYCNNCGQNANTHKINSHFLLHDIQHGILHFDKGIFYSIKEMFTRPGSSILDFIKGKRVKHFKPISMVVVIATIYSFLFHHFRIDIFEFQPPDLQLDVMDLNEWIENHFARATLATLPLYTIGTYLCYKKQGFNFLELLVLNSFNASQRLLVRIAAFPLFYYFNGTPEILLLLRLFLIIDLLLIFWTNVQFFEKVSKLKTFFLSLLSYGIFLICLYLLSIMVLLIEGIY